MRLESARLHRVGPFQGLDLDLCLEGENPRSIAVLHGAGGTGKSLVLAALACTRPGNLQRCPGPLGDSSAAAVCTWRLGQEEPQRPHGVCLTSPGFGLSDDLASEPLRRREQSHYDRQAALGGFAFLGIPASRRFSSNPLMLSDVARTLGTYDPRGGPGFSDPLKAELTRVVKQILAYSTIGAAIAEHNVAALSTGSEAFEILEDALREAIGRLCGPIGVTYRGIDPLSLEPSFCAPGVRACRFDELSLQARQLLAFAVLPVHHFWLAGHGADPRTIEGVVAIDDLELNLSEATQERVVSDLQAALPQAQWLVATTSWRIAASVGKHEVLALRHLAASESEQIAFFHGELGLTH